MKQNKSILLIKSNRSFPGFLSTEEVIIYNLVFSEPSLSIYNLQNIHLIGDGDCILRDTINKLIGGRGWVPVYSESSLKNFDEEKFVSFLEKYRPEFTTKLGRIKTKLEISFATRSKVKLVRVERLLNIIKIPGRVAVHTINKKLYRSLKATGPEVDPNSYLLSFPDDESLAKFSKRFVDYCWKEVLPDLSWYLGYIRNKDSCFGLPHDPYVRLELLGAVITAWYEKNPL